MKVAEALATPYRIDDALRMLPPTVRIGGMSKAEMLAALERAGIQLNEIAQELLADPDFQTSSTTSTLEIKDIGVGELGYAEGATLAQVFDGAGALGWQLCPLELAAHLRLQFTAQAEGFVGFPQSQNRAPPGALTVAARPLVRNGVPMGFYLRCIRGELWLRGYRSTADHVWDEHDRFVFCRAAAQPITA